MGVAFLCSWYVYLAVIAYLLARSAAPDTLLRRGAYAAAVAGLALLTTLVITWPRPVIVAVQVVPFVVGLWGIARGGRADTRYIGLFLAASAALPLFLSFWSP